MIEAKGLVKKHGNVTAVGGIDFQVSRGETVGLLGPNGAGKSSTMRMLACVSPPTSGTLRILGLEPRRDGRVIRSRLGVVPQDDSLDLELTVEENLYICGRYHGLSRATIRGRTGPLLDLVQLGDRATHRVESLSGGMRRRLTIARSLVNEPDLLLLDEPTTGLDPQARHVLWDLLGRLRRQGVTMVLTTHYMDEAEQLCDRLLVLDGGQIVSDGEPAELIARYTTREVLELRFDREDLQALAPLLAGLGYRVEPLLDRLLVYVDNGDAALAEVHARGLRPDRVVVRRGSLEDVYLRLTGRTLVD
ncbi:lipooligosaccharide transport system ATP-binding protein [Krasilnikovia cinnamomea]|uniref:Lipooligosaccharide transport system ATP-binding protein n=1 Tax=Krasilnikovia cinnamomea TaxID=349313 RepID=A0A4Q7ZMR7_9ACTN|nr:ABC transporter ATP-binding protein [Krasilnikovia cinnamomea]RZU51655.1 lipooligosaccharide transport system ATP-binding protein [Krasilnikovia cinnamomea]